MGQIQKGPTLEDSLSAADGIFQCGMASLPWSGRVVWMVSARRKERGFDGDLLEGEPGGRGLRSAPPGVSCRNFDKA